MREAATLQVLSPVPQIRPLVTLSATIGVWKTIIPAQCV